MSPRPRPRASNLRLAADIGGTFTDIAAFDDRTGELTFGKALVDAGAAGRRHQRGRREGRQRLRRPGCSCTARPSRSTPSSSARAPGPRCSSPRASATSTRSAASTGRTPTTCSSGSTCRWSSGRCASRCKERVLADGEVETPLDEAEIAALGRLLERLGVEAAAHPVSQLLCQRTSTRRAPRRSWRRTIPSMFVSASHELSQEYREFERCSTVVANAYIGPSVRRYIGEIDEHIRSDGFARLVPDRAVDRRAVRGRAGARTNACACWSPGPAAGVIGTQALCRTLGLKNAIAFDMGGTTAKAGVIYHGEALTTGAALIGGYDKALPVQIAMMDIFEVGTGGGSIARVEEGALARRPAERGRRARSRLLRPRRHRADRHRRQSRARPARRRSLPRRRDAARRRGRRARARRARRQAARHGRDRGRRRHPAHRRHRDVLRGEGRHHRARPRRRRLRAGRLWRRRAAARGAGRARDRHPDASSFRPRPACSRPSACCSPTCATTSCAPGSRGSRMRRSTRSSASIASWRRRAATAIAGTSVKPQKIVRQARGRHALCRPGARGDGRSAARACSRSEDRAGDQARVRRHARSCATAPRRPTSAPRSSACAAPSPASCASRRSEQDQARQDRAADKAAFTGKRPVSISAAGSSRRRPTPARRSRPATGSTVRR